MILFYLDEITDLYKTTNKSETKENVRRLQKMKHLYFEYKKDGMFDFMDPSEKAQSLYTKNQRYYDYMWCGLRPRERLAIRYAKAAAEKTNKSEVLIIFGAAHRFGEFIYQMKDPDICFSSAIETAPHEPPSLIEPYLAGIPMPISGILPLDDIIMGSCIVYFIQAKLTTLSEITEIYKNNRSAMTLMRLPNFIEAIEEKLISVKQVGALTEKQIKSLMESSDSGDQLKLKVENYLKSPEVDQDSQSTVLKEMKKPIENTKDQIVKLFENYDVFGWRNHRARSRAVAEEIKKAKDHEVVSILDSQLGVFEGSFDPSFLRTDKSYIERWVLPIALQNKRKGKYYQTVQEAIALLKTPTNS